MRKQDITKVAIVTASLVTLATIHHTNQCHNPADQPNQTVSGSAR